ncbi:hypothetical protein BZA77DRAFT_351613 [Pyronema omphalodes]|nr:hypothetical protein BZA77DRAFT_351613 [Pyronema omphalodes]
MPNRLKLHLRTSFPFLFSRNQKSQTSPLKSQFSVPSSSESSQASGSKIPVIIITAATPCSSCPDLTTPSSPINYTPKPTTCIPSTSHTPTRTLSKFTKLTKSRTPRAPINKLDSRYSRQRGCNCPESKCTYEYRTRPPTDQKLWCCCCKQCGLLQLLMEESFKDEDEETEKEEVEGIKKGGLMTTEDREVADWWSWTGGRDRKKEMMRDKGKGKLVG